MSVVVQYAKHQAVHKFCGYYTGMKEYYTIKLKAHTKGLYSLQSNANLLQHVPLTIENREIV